MTLPKLTKIAATRAAEICKLVTLDAEATRHLDADVTPAAFLDRLLAHNAFVDAIRFLAYALPKREATWWACLSTRSTLPRDAEVPVETAVKMAEAWVYNPSEENRRAALDAGEKIGSISAAGWTALAAGWAGGSLGPPNGPVIAPGENLTPAAVAVALIEAALAGGGDVSDRFRRFLASGLDIASGGTGRSKSKSA